MGIFDIFKKTPASATPWRDNNGKLSCPGDDCPRRCNEDCPIWCQTVALTAMQGSNRDLAVEKFQKAVLLAPDYKEAWVNMAAIYGMSNNHLEANKAYLTAYQLDNTYKNALFGLIMSYANLGQFDEALKYCDEYAQKISQNEADDFKRQIREKQAANTTSRIVGGTEIFLCIVEHARETGLLGPNSNVPNIPEIVAYRKITCQKVLIDLINNAKCSKPDVWAAWGAYAGMGAVALWNKDWESLKNKGIAETLLEPRGSEEMDEFVHELIGIPFDSEDGKNLVGQIYNLAFWTLAKYGKDVKKEDIKGLTCKVPCLSYPKIL